LKKYTTENLRLRFQTTTLLQLQEMHTIVTRYLDWQNSRLWTTVCWQLQHNEQLT